MKTYCGLLFLFASYLNGQQITDGGSTAVSLGSAAVTPAITSENVAATPAIQSACEKCGDSAALTAPGKSGVSANTEEGVSTPGSAGMLGRVGRLMNKRGLAVNVTQTVEVYRAGYKGSAIDANIRALSDFVFRYNLPGVLQRASATAKYSMYTESGSSTDPSAQGFSNLTSQPFRRLMEAYLDAPVGNLRIKVGKVDANTEFAAVQNGGDFSNAALGVSPTLFAMPSYPEGAPSVNVFASFFKKIDIGAGFYRTPVGALYSVGEANFRRAGRRQTRIGAGYWKQTALRNSFTENRDAAGSYVIFEQNVLPIESGERGLRFFARLSLANGSSAPAYRHMSYGATWTGIRQKDDAIGFAVLDLVPAAEEGQVMKSEMAYEVYYKFPAGKYATVKTDFERIERPCGVSNAPAGMVASIRLMLNFSTRGD